MGKYIPRRHIFHFLGENRAKKRKSSVMSHGRRREIIPSLHKCMDYVERKAGRGSSTLSGPLKYGGSVAFSWFFMDKKRRTSYILRRHCINACYSCSAFVELAFLSSFILRFSLPLSLSRSPFSRPSSSFCLHLSILTSLFAFLYLHLSLFLYPRAPRSPPFPFYRRLRADTVHIGYPTGDV